MKKKYFIILVILLDSIITFGQPAINSADFPANYSANFYVIADNQVFSPGTAGENRVWDFSTAILPTIPDGTLSVVPISIEHDVSNFPLANYIVKTTSVSSDFPIYFFYKLSLTIFELVGYVDVNDIDHGEIEVFTNPKTILEFPYDYNTVINDTYKYVGGKPTSFTATYDAYGTLILPFATYNNVIRQKRTEFGYDFYTFFTLNPFSIIMEGNFLPLGYVKIYQNTTSLGVNEINKENTITIYPNPSSSFVNLRLSNQNIIDKVVITDLVGKIVLQQNPNGGQIDVQGLSRGMYILQVFSAKMKSIRLNL